MIQKICTIEEIDCSMLTFQQPVARNNSGKFIYFYHNKTPLFIQTPLLYTPFGLSNYDDRYSLNVSLSDASFLKTIQDIENKIIDEAHSKSWLRDKTSREVVAELFSSSIKYPNSGNYSPTLRLSAPFKDNKFDFETYVKKQISVDETEIVAIDNFNKDSLPKGSKIMAILQCSTIWIAGNKFGCTFKIKQLMMTSEGSNTRVNAFSNYAFIDDVDDEDKE